MSTPHEPAPSESAGEVADDIQPPVEGSLSETDAQTLIRRTPSGNDDDAAASSNSGSVTVGSTLGPYQIARKLGQGGMGAVFEARHTKLKKTFAVKVLPPEMMKTPAMVARFEREMEAVGALDHPHIVRATDAGEFNGTHFLVMEYVEGTDLSQLVKRDGPLPVDVAMEVIRQAALGLQHAHEHGLVHRDIKPSNLLMSVVSGPSSVGTSQFNNGPLTTDHKPIIKILDLGLARLGGDDSPSGLTSSGQLLGTPDYMAPEQWDDTRSVDARADLYSLGCTLAFLLTGKAPFDNGKQRSVLHIMKAHADAAAPDLTALRPEVSAEVNALFQQLMAKRPEDRFQSAAEVVAVLESLRSRSEQRSPVATRSPVAPRQESRTSLDMDRATAPTIAPGWHAQSEAMGVGDANTSVGHSLPDGQGVPPSRASDSSATTDITRETGTPVAERQGYVDAPTTSILAPRTSSRKTSTTRQRVILAVSLLAFVVLGVIVIKIIKKDGSTLEVVVPGDTKKVEITDSKMAAPGRPSDVTSNANKTAEGGHPTGWPADAPKPAIAPFNADEARQHQEAWAKYLNMPVEYENTIGMKFRVIPPGEFAMGASDEEFAALEKNTKVALAAGTITQAQADETLKLFAAETPQHRVRLTKPLAFGACEVTQAQYERVMGVNPSWWSATGRGKEEVVGISTSEHPVGGVNWIDAASFCNKLSQSEGLTPCYEIDGTNVKHLAGNGYRLATEAEWEYACRAGTTSTHWSGSPDFLSLKNDTPDTLSDFGWASYNSNGMTHPVGLWKSNPFGLHDMHGNAEEWCDDTYDANAYAERAKRNAVVTDPRVFQVDGGRITRGGNHAASTHLSRSAFRQSHLHADNAAASIGFRVVCSTDAVRQSPKLAERIAAIQNAPQVERAAAAKVLQAGGAVTVQLLGGDPWAIKVIKLGEPLPNGPFVVHGVNFRDQPGRENVGDDALIALAECRHIASLSLSGTNIGPRGAIVLSGFPALRYLHLGQKQPTSTLLGMAGLTALSAIELETAQIDDDFEYLKAAKALRNLTLWGEQKPDWKNLGELTQLRAVNFPDLNELDTADVEAFQKRNPHCQVWVNHGANRRWLGRNVVGEAASQLLARKFVLEGRRSGTASVMRLAEDSPNKAAVDHVRTLYLPAEIAVTEDDLALIDQLNGDLQQCHVTGQPQSNRIAAMLARNPTLVAVSFRNSPFSDDGLKSLQSLTGLRLLVVEHTQATPAGIAAFRRAVPGCHIVSDFGTFDPQWLPPDQFDLNRRIAARAVDRGGSLHLVTEGSNWQHVVVTKPMALPAGRFLIDVLSFKNCPTVVSSDLAGVGDLRQLRLFGFPYTQVNRDAIPHIRNLRGVVDFAPNECGMKSSDLDQLPEWPTVEMLWLMTSMIDDQFQSLRRFPNLRLLSLAVDGPLPDLTSLGQFPNLRHVNVFRKTAILPEVVQELQRRNPRLLITMGDESGSQTLGEDVARKAARKLLELGIPVLHNEIHTGPFKPTTLAEVDTVKACQWHCDEIPASVSFEVAHHALLTHVEHFRFAAIGCRHADPLAVALTEHQGMRSVNLQESDLTDEGLKTLAKLRALRTLIVTKTRITRAAAEEFGRLVPDCWLYTDFGDFLPAYRQDSLNQR